MQVALAAEPTVEPTVRVCIYVHISDISLIEKVMAIRKKCQISNKRRMCLLRDYVAC